MSLVSSASAAVDAHADRLVLDDRAAPAAPRWDKARVTAGIPAAHRDEDICRLKPAMKLTRLDQRVRVLAVLLVVFAVAVFADVLHPVDRPLGLRKQE